MIDGKPDLPLEFFTASRSDAGCVFGRNDIAKMIHEQVSEFVLSCFNISVG